MNEELGLIKKLEAMRNKHRDLDQRIESMPADDDFNFEKVRLKKEKLMLRDEISRIEKLVYPDIIA